MRRAVRARSALFSPAYSAASAWRWAAAPALALFALDTAGLAKTTAFVTDGQLSGLCLKGLTVAEVAPEAATGGPIGKVRDGETIRISVASRSIDLDVPAEEFAARDGPGYVNAATGCHASFRQDVQPMSTGGVLLPPCC